MLEDGVLDNEEAAELLSILRSISGEHTELGEIAKTASLPLCIPAPEVEFKDKVFLFTGTFAYGTRRQCQAVIDSLGGKNASGVTKKLDYLVIGTYVTDSWIHESFGRKIEKAMEYRDSGESIAIIAEEHWADQAKL